jgi:alanine-alpha-ketoisovalerate/valine-pyruvate aminotransferase
VENKISKPKGILKNSKERLQETECLNNLTNYKNHQSWAQMIDATVKSLNQNPLTVNWLDVTA